MYSPSTKNQVTKLKIPMNHKEKEVILRNDTFVNAENKGDISLHT